jgi:hypothetical protein
MNERIVAPAKAAGSPLADGAVCETPPPVNADTGHPLHFPWSIQKRPRYSACRRCHAR